MELRPFPLMVGCIKRNDSKRTTFIDNVGHNQLAHNVDIDKAHPRSQGTLHQQGNTYGKPVPVSCIDTKVARQHTSSCKESDSSGSQPHPHRRTRDRELFSLE